MRAILRTRCGCQRKVEIPEKKTFIEIPFLVYSIEKACMGEGNADDACGRIRRFEFWDTSWDPILREEIAYYLEVLE